tara:strand:- start:717 stop:1292 length:576 start_codon:yes stop_codon:yes gene_type:complete
MKRSNNLIIAALIFVIIAILFITKEDIQAPEPLYPISYFSYTDQDNSVFTVNNLKNKVSIVDFFFTSCQGPCPAMNRYMKELVEEFSSSDKLQFISFSVDPVNDSREVIREYINTGYLNYKNWYFLETDTLSISNLLEDGFKLSGEGLPGMHSTKFILTDANGYIVGYYNPFVSKEFSLLKEHISYLLESI